MSRLAFPTWVMQDSIFLPSLVWRRPSKNTAVAFKSHPDGTSYANIIKRAKEGVDLKQLGIVNSRMRRANGGVLIEIPGSEEAIKVNSLSSCLREVIGQNALMSRPVVKMDVRFSGFDKSKIITAITDIGGCLACRFF